MAWGAPQPVIVAFIVDATGSVKNYDLNRVRRLAPDLLANLPQGSQVALLAFRDRSQVLLERTSDRGAVELAIDGLSVASGHAVLNDALYAAGDYLKKQRGRHKAIVVISNGRDSGSILSVERSLDQAHKEGIPIFAIAAGKADLPALRDIAAQTGGQCTSLLGTNGYLLAAGIEKALGLGRQEPTPTLPSPPPPPAPSWVALAGISLVAALGLAGAASALWYRRRNRPTLPCAVCGTILEAPGAFCPNCARLAPVALVQDRPVPPPSSQGTVRLQGAELGTRRLDLHSASLLIQSGPGAGNVFTLRIDASLLLGRSPAADILLSDSAVSQQHCRIRFQGNTFLLQDLKSSNGTYVNGLRNAECFLEHGDIIRVGETTLVFRMG
jgi:hypothetical protein